MTRSPTVMHNYVRCQCSTGQLSLQEDTPLTANCAVTWNGRSSDGYVTILWLDEDKTVLLYSCVEMIQLGSKCSFSYDEAETPKNSCRPERQRSGRLHIRYWDLVNKIVSAQFYNYSIS